MVQNTSTAVMARRVATTDALDFYPTPPWATRALCRWLSSEYKLHDQSAWDPACGECDMVRPLQEYFKTVRATDIASYKGGHECLDFLTCNIVRIADFIITNPPFTLAEEFALQALERSRLGVALLVRTAFLETIGRYERLFSVTPPTDILQFSERVVMHHGKLSQFGSTATAYCWVIFRKKDMAVVRRWPTVFTWIKPCRAELERDGDYPLVLAPGARELV